MSHKNDFENHKFDDSKYIVINMSVRRDPTTGRLIRNDFYQKDYANAYSSPWFDETLTPEAYVLNYIPNHVYRSLGASGVHAIYDDLCGVYVNMRAGALCGSPPFECPEWYKESLKYSLCRLRIALKCLKIALVDTVKK